MLYANVFDFNQLPKEKVSKVESVVRQLSLEVKNVSISSHKSDTKTNVNMK